MKKIVNFIKQKINWILVVIGAYMIICSIFDFIIIGGTSSRLFLQIDKVCSLGGYLYISNNVLTIVFGIVLLVVGISMFMSKAKK